MDNYCHNSQNMGNGVVSGADSALASVLRADLPRLRSVLDVYATCLEQLVGELSATGESVERRRALLAHLRRDYNRILVDLERIVAVVDAAEPDGVPFGRRLRAVMAEIDRDEPGVARRGWRDRNRLRPDSLRRRRCAGEA
ncbi:hypothetical protein [Rhodoplanes serenus]|uniref:hypothetical protein n=1 Tax=Rhodoplanes serenus TaxID=200615 RepID=UPI0011B9468D|nr:hypothetical protein [Rhodoplanes serenus]